MAIETEKQEAIGEVIASSVTGLTIQAWQKQGQRQDLNKKGSEIADVFRPAFGSFLCAQSLDSELKPITVVALVYNVITEPKDTMHKAQALGLSRGELAREQPQIFSLFQTEIKAQTVGYLKDDCAHHTLPPHPPYVHEFVRLCTPSEINQITESMGFLRLAARVTEIPSDELLAASIAQAAAFRKNNNEFLVEAGKALAQLFHEDYDRLIFVLEKIKP